MAQRGFGNVPQYGVVNRTGRAGAHAQHCATRVPDPSLSHGRGIAIEWNKHVRISKSDAAGHGSRRIRWDPFDSPHIFAVLHVYAAQLLEQAATSHAAELYFKQVKGYTHDGSVDRTRGAAASAVHPHRSQQLVAVLYDSIDGCCKIRHVGQTVLSFREVGPAFVCSSA